MEWIVDSVGPGFAQATQIQDILFDGRSAFQHIQIASSPMFGRMLILDDAVQTTERDEYMYHEMLAHLPLLTHPAPRRVLIIGGGDGGTLEETLKHPIEHATLVEIDPDVVTVSRRFLPGISGGAFDDARTSLVIADGIEFVRTASERFDVILVDSTDPKGPGLALFSPEFYASCTRVLAPEGLLVAQTGSLLYQRELTDMVRRHLATAFPVVGTYWAAVPAYPGVLWGFSYGSLRHDPGRVNRTAISKRLATIPTRFYSADTHAAALQLPGLPQG
jgi:spermidine synthase